MTRRGLVLLLLLLSRARSKVLLKERLRRASNIKAIESSVRTA
jgi:hypothetical protein